MSESIQMPTHVAIIMDGNGRWAQKRGLPRTAGHKAGAETLRKMVEFAAQSGIEFLTCYAFSTENWKRPKTEVSFLMTLLSTYLEKEAKDLAKNGIRLKVLGDTQGLSSKLQKQIQKAEEITAKGTRLQLNLAINYGGQQEILAACQKFAVEVEQGLSKPNEITIEKFESLLTTQNIPNPDLLIRPGGDYRISNFLLWQLAYTELWFSPILWPDFSEKEFELALENFKNRERRFGGVVQ
ncbi:MAG: isoprenyl transferase [Negativicutes bacterium]|nr:isoprenyl transferase [Negativicutes bacterium]